jgi:hypothetical protein
MDRPMVMVETDVIGRHRAASKTAADTVVSSLYFI